MANAKAKTFQQVVDEAARQLMVVEEAGNGLYVRTPLLYASGSTVVVRVEDAGSDYFVTDFGAGHIEAEWLGGDLIFKRTAKTIAEAAGIGFDHFAFFAARASRDQLPGAIATVANASQEAVHVTAMKVAEKRVKDDADDLYDRLVDVFTPAAVTRDATVTGASNTEWHIASLVQQSRKVVAFEAVTKHPNSVVFAATKFNDLSRLEKPPGRVAVVQKKAQLRTYLGVLSQSANVIEHAAADDVYEAVIRSAA